MSTTSSSFSTAPLSAINRSFSNDFLQTGEEKTPKKIDLSSPSPMRSRSVTLDQELTNPNSKILSALNRIHAFVTAIDEYFRVFFLSDNYSKIMGRTRESSLGEIGYSDTHPEDVYAFKTIMENSSSQENFSQTMRIRKKHKDGRYLLFEDRVFITNRNGRVDNVIIFSERLNGVAPEQYLANPPASSPPSPPTQKLRALGVPQENNTVKFMKCLQATHALFFIIDHKGSIKEITNGVESVLGYTRDEVMAQQNHFELIHPEDRSELQPLVSTSPSVRSSVARQIYLLSRPLRKEHKNGEYVELRAKFFQISLNREKALFVIESSTPSTTHIEELLLARRDLRAETERRQQLEAQIIAERRMFAYIIHEIRNPMNAAMNLARLLGKNILDIGKAVTDSLATTAPLFGQLAPKLKQASEDLETIDIAHQSMLNVANEALLLNKIGEHKLHLDIQPCNLQQMLQSSIKLIATNNKKNIAIEITDLSAVNVTCDIDAHHLGLVLNNYLTNAIKYTNEGGSIKIEASLSHDRRMFKVSVKDNGRGISEADLPRVFQPFEQVKAADAKIGTGMGLATCKKIIEYMGGEVAVVSLEGVGSTFSFVVPVKLSTSVVANKGEVKKITNLAPEHYARLRVLIADDNKTNLRVMSRLLTSLGLNAKNITMVQNGVAAVEAAIKNSFDFIFTDVQMPIPEGELTPVEVIDGYEATRRMRSQGVQVPIIGVSGECDEEAQMNGVQAGMNMLLAKPFTGAKINDILMQSHDKGEKQSEAKE